MVQKVHIVLEDDIDGSDAAETVRFGLDGTRYEIDLNEKNAAKLRDALAPYIGHGRKVTGGAGGGGRRGRRGGGASSGPVPAEVREWARANGFEVPNRGRIPSEVREAYDAAH